MFGKLNIRARLIGGFGIIIAIALVVGITGYYSLNKVMSVSRFQSQVLTLEKHLDEILISQEKYRQSGSTEHYKQIQTSLKSASAKIQMLADSGMGPAALADLVKGAKTYEGLLLQLKTDK